MWARLSRAGSRVVGPVPILLVDSDLIHRPSMARFTEHPLDGALGRSSFAASVTRPTTVDSGNLRLLVVVCDGLR